MRPLVFVICTLIWPVLLCGQDFKPNSVGLVFLRCERVHTYEVEIVFPMNCVSGMETEIRNSEYKTSYPGVYNQNGIILFDDRGLNGEIHIQNYIFKMWCENDAGFHYRPTFQGIIEKSKLKRPLKAISWYDISCFALINPNIESWHHQKIDRKKVVLKGDVNGDGKKDVLLWLQPDDAKNCDGDKEYWLMLDYNGNSCYMNCCGP